MNFLTVKERECAGLCAQGKSSKEIADVMGVSKRTVDFHIANIFRKLKIKNRVQLAMLVHGVRVGA